MISTESSKQATALPDWEKIGMPRWYDCKLGKMGDKKLSAVSGVKCSRIRARREIFGIPRWTVAVAIAPFAPLLGKRSDAYIARLCGVSPSSVKTFREAAGIARRQQPVAAPRIPTGHPVKPYGALLGQVEDKALAALAGVSTQSVTSLRKRLRVDPVKAFPRPPKRRAVPDFSGPLLGYESSLGVISDAKISRATGLPLGVIEQRRKFLGIEAYQRTSRIVEYEHLLKVETIPSAVLAKLVGLSATRISELRRMKDL